MITLDKIKVYFKLTDSSYDLPIQCIIDNIESLQKSLRFDANLCFYMAVEDVTAYLRTGESSFSTANADVGLLHYSQPLQEAIRRSIPARVYPDKSEPVPPEPVPSVDDAIKTINPTDKSSLFDMYYPQMYASYTDANAYLHDKFIAPSGCSGFYNEGYQGRSFDWFRNGSAKILLKTSASDSSFASLSVLDGVSDLTPKFVGSKVHAAIYKYVPYMVVSGINEKHIAVQVNQLPSIDHDPCTGTNAGKSSLCSMMVCKLLLDKCEDINDVASILNEWNIYDPQQGDLKGSYQWIVSSPLGVRLVNIIENKVRVLNPKTYSYPAVATNYIPYSPEPHDQGIERYSTLSSGLSGVTDKASALSLLQQVKYSKCYDADTTLYSEFYGVYSDGFDWDRETDVSNPRCAEILATARQMYLDNDPATWYTSHACVLDTYSNTLSIAVEEDYSTIIDYKVEDIPQEGGH